MVDFISIFGEKITVWFLKHFNKKLLKKHFPFKEDDLKLTISSAPHIYANEEINDCTISFGICLQNYTDYDLFVSHIHIKLTVNSYRLLESDKILLRNIRKKDGPAFHFEIPLTYYQVKRIVSDVKGDSLLHSHFKLEVAIKNIFGEQVYTKDLFEKIEVKYIPNK